MEKEALIIQTRQKIDEVNNKLQEIKDEMAQENTFGKREEIKSILDELESIRNDIQSQYLSIKFEDYKDDQFSEMEKSIFSNLESFNRAFTKAGFMFSNNMRIPPAAKRF